MTQVAQPGWVYNPTRWTWNSPENAYKTVPYPYQFNQNFVHQQNNLIRVAGPESAKEYPLGPNSAVILMDAENPVFYLKTTDDGGFATLRMFDFEERVEKEKVIDVSPEIYASKDDIEVLRKSLDDIKETLKGLM